MVARIQGEAELLRSMENLERNSPRAFAKALFTVVLEEEKEMKHRTPVDFGPLSASYESKLDIKRGQISATITVGGPSAPYALVVHEDLEAAHEVGQAKYMESVLMESRPHIARRIASHVDLRRAT